MTPSFRLLSNALNSNFVLFWWVLKKNPIINYALSVPLNLTSQREMHFPMTLIFISFEGI